MMAGRMAALCAAAIGLALGTPTRAADDTAEDVNQVSMEVAALRTLQKLQPSATQLKALAALVKPTFVKPGKRDAAKAGPRYRANLLRLRTALVNDVEADIKTSLAKVEDLEEDQELDDGIEITRPAALQAVDAVRLFTPQQVLSYLSTYEEDLPDPVAILLDALEEGQDEDAEDWKDTRDEAADEAAWLLGGLFNKQANGIREAAKEWLDKKHALKGEALEKQRDALSEELLKEFGRKTSPLNVLRHVMLHDMAELLSNPRLPAAVEARLKNLEAEK